MTTCPRCGQQHNRKLDPRGRPGGDVDCTTWWCPRGHKWREVGHRVGPERMGPGSVLVSDDRYGAGWAKPALVLDGRIYRCDGNTYRARNDADTDWLDDGTVRWAAPIVARNAADEPRKGTPLHPGAIDVGGQCHDCYAVAHGDFGKAYCCLCADGIDDERCERYVSPSRRATGWGDYRDVVTPRPISPAHPPKSPLPRPERVEPWQVWEVAQSGLGPVLIVECGSGDIICAVSMCGTTTLSHGWLLAATHGWQLRGWFKPGIGDRVWTGRVPLQAGLYRATEADMLDPTNGDWLPDGTPTDADIAEWRETWGKA